MLLSKVGPVLQREIIKLSVCSSNLHSSSPCTQKNSKCGPKQVAIILCGCGALDGTEISEAISATIHCCQKELKPKFYAPNMDILGVMDHLCKNPDSSKCSRNALVEAARLARSKIEPLCECNGCSADALIIPGGFGCARTLSDFESKGADCVLLPDFERVVQEFGNEKKPIGAICIAAVLLAKVFHGAKITLGKDKPREKWPHAEAIEQAKKMGAKVKSKDARQVLRCKKYNLFSTPAWMYNGTYSDIHEGIGKMVTAMKKSIK